MQKKIRFFDSSFIKQMPNILLLVPNPKKNYIKQTFISNSKKKNLIRIFYLVLIFSLFLNIKK